MGKNNEIETSVQEQELAVATAATTEENISTTEYLRSAKKEYALIKGAKARVDLLKKTYCITVPVFEAGSTLMGLPLFQVHHAENDLAAYGANIRFNLCEEFIKDDSDITDPNRYAHIDAYGERHYLRDQYYYLDNNSVLTETQVNEMVYDESVGGYMHDGYPVEYDAKTVNGWQLVEAKNRAETQNYVLYLQEAIGGVKANLSITDELGTPTLYMSKGNQIKVFDAGGRLIQICDYNGNFVCITYVNTLNGGKGISHVFDNKGNVISFTYDQITGRLSKIEDSRGRVVEYVQGGDTIDEMAYSKLIDGAMVEYDSIVFTYATTSDGKRTMTIGQGGCTDADTATITPGLGEGRELKFIFWNPQENRLTFSYNEERVAVIDQDGVQQQYFYGMVGGKTQISEYIEYSYGRYRQYIKFEEGMDEIGFPLRITKYAKRKNLCKTTLNKEIGTVHTVRHNRHLKVTESVTGVQVTPTVTKSMTTDYSYDERGRLKKQRTEETYSTGVRFVYVTEYAYNDVEKTDEEGNAYTAYGKVRKKISYVEGEEQTTGIYYEFYTYDDNGRLLKTKAVAKKCTCSGECTCKQLEDSDSLKGFVMQQTYDEQGRIITQKDESGVTTEREYVEGTNLVSKVIEATNAETVTEYDNRDRITKLLCNSNYNTMNYDDNNRVTGMGNNASANYLQYAYDSKRRLSQVSLNGTAYESFVYVEDERFFESDQYLSDYVTVTNANGEKFKAVNCPAGMWEKYFYTPAPTENEPTPTERYFLTNLYNEYGQLSEILDAVGGTEELYTYDDSGALVGWDFWTNSSVEPVKTVTYEYDDRGRLKKSTFNNSRVEEHTYEANSRGLRTGYSVGPFSFAFEYDEYGRLKQKTASVSGIVVSKENYTYRTVNNQLRNQILYVEDEWLGILEEYTYDARGNIRSVTKNNFSEAEYQYDGCGRLMREINRKYNLHYNYIYNEHGDIRARMRYSSGNGTDAAYRYNGDQLSSYNGEACVYDAVGNPTTYRGKNLTWSRGRKLMSFDGVDFDYDGCGRRTHKNGFMIIYDDQDRVLGSGEGIEYFYDGKEPIGCKYNNQYYYYKKDAQGNIWVLLDSNGMVVVQYWYDAWGNHKVCDVSGNEITDTMHIGHMNAYRYRGYYYDRETGLYYLKSRYYDPETGRFINRDSVAYADASFLNGLNLYAYCNNNPVMHIDPNGSDWNSFKNGWNSFWNDARDWFVDVGKEIKNFFVSTFDLAVNYEKIDLDIDYNFLYQIEAGEGTMHYLKGDKPITFCLNAPTEWWRFWEYSLSVNIKSKDTIARVDLIGTSMGVSIWSGDSGTEISTNILGRGSITNYTNIKPNGMYSFTRGSLNFPEIGALILAFAAALSVATAPLAAFA